MNDMYGVDVLEGISRMNPVPDEHLDVDQQQRSEAILARIVESAGADADTSAGARAGREGLSKRGHPQTVPRQRPVEAHAGDGRARTVRRTGLRRASRGLAVAIASVLGLGAAAYATGVTPGSVSEGIKALRSADMGTVTYPAAPAAEGSAVLEGIARRAAASQDLGDPDKVVVAHSLSSVDGWYSDDTQPGIMTVDRWDWTLGDGVRRYRTVETSRDGVNPDTPSITMYLEELPPDPNPLYHPELQRIGRDVVLGPTPSATIATLLGEESPGSARADWMVLDSYQGFWNEGIGLTASNRAAFVQALATLDYDYYGVATDQLGRTGEAFGVHWRGFDGDDEYRIVLDPDNGALLAVESVLHGPWILGSQDHVTSSVTMVSVEAVDSVPACEDISGCEVARIG